MNSEFFERGLKIRKEVVGEEYVNASLTNSDEFTLPIQELVTEYCWGAIWGREDIDRRTRSIINIAMISILNRPAELGIHVRGALRNGVTKIEIREILMQVAIYAGVPAAIDSFRVARKAIEEFEGLQS